MVDLTSYKTRILSAEDEPLFEDAVKAASSGALRAAYVMIWLSCAESLKRKFREAQIRDGTAAKIVGDLAKKEAEHRSIDKFLLDKACEYGFLSDSAHTILLHVYEMRCIYGHPYEEAPSEEQVFSAAAATIDHVLSHPVKLRHGFGSQLLDNLLKDPLYLDNQRNTVEQFAKEIILRIDISIHTWLLKKYWKGLEVVADDPTMKVFFSRGIWFTQTYLKEVGVSIFSSEQWHDNVKIFPKTLIRIFAMSELFSQVGQHAQDYLVGKLIEESDSRSNALYILECLYNNKVLSTRQIDRFVEKINTSNFAQLISSKLSIDLCFDKTIDALSSYNWYEQNTAIDFVRSNSIDKLNNLPLEKQRILGRNILQAAEGNSRSARNLLEIINENWPINLIKGIVLEVFINEELEIRFKTACFSEVMNILNKLKAEERSEILAEVEANVRAGQPKYSSIDKASFLSTSQLLEGYEWSATLKQCIDERASLLTDEEQLP